MKPKSSAARRLVRSALVLIFACSCLEGCFGGGPRYPAYGYPGYGYAPYSYGFPGYVGGYNPMFTQHHEWEDHHMYGHENHFWRPMGQEGYFGGPHWSGGREGGGGRFGGDGGRFGGGDGDHH